MAVIRKIDRSGGGLSNFRQDTATGGSAFAVLAEAAGQAYQAIAPLAVEEAAQLSDEAGRAIGRQIAADTRLALPPGLQPGTQPGMQGGTQYEWQTGLMNTGAPRDPNEAPATAMTAPLQVNMSPLPASLVTSESGGNLGLVNTLGYGGRGQFGTARLQEAFEAGVLPSAMTGAQYAQQPLEVQARVEQWQIDSIGQFARDNDLMRFIGTTIGGVTVTPNGMMAVAHLGGNAGLRRFLTSGGREDRTDAYGTSLSDYLARHQGDDVAWGGAGSDRIAAPRSEFDRDGVTPAAVGALARLEQSSGMTFDINSAHRTAGENTSAGGARQSQHIHGNAFDINVSGMSEPDRVALIRQARAAGFGGVGVYANTLHFDVGPTRHWGSDYSSSSLPSWAAEAVGAPRGTDTLIGGPAQDTLGTSIPSRAPSGGFADTTLGADVRSALFPPPVAAPAPVTPQMTQPSFPVPAQAPNAPAPTMVRDSSGRLRQAHMWLGLTEIGQAYNAGLRVAVLSETSLAVRTNMMALSEQFVGDPEGFQQAAQEYGDQLVRDLDPMLVRDVRQQVGQESERRFLGMVEERYAETRQRAENSSAALIERWAQDYAEALVTGDQAEIGAAQTRLEQVLVARESLPGLAWTREQSQNVLLAAHDSAQRLAGTQADARSAELKQQLQTAIAAREQGMIGADEAILNDAATWELQPELAQELMQWTEFRAQFPGFEALPPPAQQAEIDQMRASGITDQYQLTMVRTAEQAAARAREAWASDPMAQAEAVLPVPPPVLPLYDIDNPQPFIDGLNARRDYGMALAGAGYVTQPVFFSNEEADELAMAMATDVAPEARLAVAAALNAGFEGQAAAVFRQIGADDPVIQFAGIMGGERATYALGLEAMRGQTALASGQARAPSAIVPTADMSVVLTGLTQDQRHSVTEVARGLLAARVPAGDPTPEQMAVAMQSAMGQTTRASDGQLIGGVQTVLGAPLFLPANVNGRDLDRALRQSMGLQSRVTNRGEQIVTGIRGVFGFGDVNNPRPNPWMTASTFPDFNLAGSMPYVNGEPMPSSVLNDGTLRLVPRGDGLFEADVHLAGRPEPVERAGGGRLIIDLTRFMGATQ